MNRIAMFDATLARLYHDLQTAEARQAGAAQEMKQAKDKLDAELAKPQAEQCAHCISDLKARDRIMRENDCRSGYANHESVHTN